jgi:hypothetical protein
MAEIFETIDLAYTSINIYNSVIVYEDNTDIEDLKNLLTDHLYPWVVIDNYDENFDLYAAKYRMFLLRQSEFCKYLHYRRYDLCDISIIICTSHDVFDSVCANLEDAHTNEDIILLSIENKNSD